MWKDWILSLCKAVFGIPPFSYSLEKFFVTLRFQFYDESQDLTSEALSFLWPLLKHLIKGFASLCVDLCFRVVMEGNPWNEELFVEPMEELGGMEGYFTYLEIYPFNHKDYRHETAAFCLTMISKGAKLCPSEGNWNMECLSCEHDSNFWRDGACEERIFYENTL